MFRIINKQQNNYFSSRNEIIRFFFGDTKEPNREEYEINSYVRLWMPDFRSENKKKRKNAIWNDEMFREYLYIVSEIPYDNEERKGFPDGFVSVVYARDDLKEGYIFKGIYEDLENECDGHRFVMKRISEEVRLIGYPVYDLQFVRKKDDGE